MSNERYIVDQLTCASLRGIVHQSCGIDPGDIRPEALLERISGGALGRYSVICAIEARYDVDFPDDLVAAIETVDDLLYFTATKVDQANR